MSEQRIHPGNSNLELWHRMMPTDAKLSIGGAEKDITKPFTRSGGFKGTAINSTYVVMRLTAAFGPVGLGWGYEVVTDDVVTGAPVYDEKKEVLGHEMVQRTRIRFWWRNPEQITAAAEHDYACRNSFEQFGQTMLVSYIKSQGRFVTDEEAWKKSLTDAITKAASHLGIAADVHLGLWDDNKYTAGRAEAADEMIQQQASDVFDTTRKNVERQVLALVELFEVATTDTLNALLGEAAALRATLRALGMAPSVETLRLAVTTARQRLDAAA